MRRVGSFVLALALQGGVAVAADAPPAVGGLWLTQDKGGVIRIGPCDGGLCGWIVGVVVAPGKPPPTDVHDQPLCGLKLIERLRPSGSNVWQGDITNPHDGRTYDARLTTDQPGQLRLRGYALVPLFGSTQIWTRYKGTVTPDCRMVRG